jgi:hypothetical protein
MAIIIAERSFATPLADGEREHLFTRLGPCLGQHGATWIRSFLSRDRRRMVCVFESPDAELVRVAHRVAGVTFERIWVADELD